MIKNDFIDFERRDFLTTSVDDLLESTGDSDVTIRI